MTRMKLLLVEDNEADAVLLQESLADVGVSSVQTARAQTLHEALALMTAERFDTVLLDLSLPDSGGLNTVQRAVEAADGMPIIVMTGLNDEQLATEALRLGAQDYLVKGQADGLTVSRAIRYAIERSRIEQALRDSERSYRLAVDGAGLGAWELDLQTRMLLCDERAAEMLGVTKDVPQPLEPLLKRLHAEDMDARLARLREQVAAGRLDDEGRVESPSGRVRWLRATGQVLHGRGGRRRLVGVLQDTTDHKQAEQAALQHRIIEAIQAEQQRIGHNLHDGLQGTLVGLSMMLAGVKQSAAAGKPKLAADIAQLQQAVALAIQQMRGLANSLCPADLRGDGLIKALADLAASTGELFRVPCEFTCGDGIALPPERIASHLYYIAHEALNNALKHGRPSRILMRLEDAESSLTLTVQDDGCGMPGDMEERNGMGMRTMSYRADVIGASLQIVPAQPRGTTVRCVLPRRAY